MSNQCDAESCGYTCIRTKGHGMIHVSPEQMHNPNIHGNGWIRWPHGVDEMNQVVPWSGYLLVSDDVLEAARMRGLAFIAKVE